MALSISKVQARIARALETYASIPKGAARVLLPSTKVAGKTYEALVLVEIMRRFMVHEAMTFRLIGAKRLDFRWSNGPLNRAKYPHLDVSRAGTVVAELWTDCNFLSMSAHSAVCVAHSRMAARGEYHEVDILLTSIGAPNGHVCHDFIVLAVECKHRRYGKMLLRELLGMRRMLSKSAKATSTIFTSWPSAVSSQNPASWLLAFGSDSRMTSFQLPGDAYDLRMFHLPWP